MPVYSPGYHPCSALGFTRHPDAASLHTASDAPCRAAMEAFFRVDHALNISSRAGVPRLFMPDVPLMRTAIQRLAPNSEERSTLQIFLSVFHSDVC